LNHVFDLSKPGERGALLHLAQHHGYPTPLLDWTWSPYVAAFFAYRGISNKYAANAAPEERVRIVLLASEQWRDGWQQYDNLLTATPHFSVLETMLIENSRAIPQQAAITISNIDDIESYVAAREPAGDPKYLMAIELPVHAREQVVRELSFMGVTAGSLLPGLDGACEELKERHFTGY
jgi:hypothetical protein